MTMSESVTRINSAGPTATVETITPDTARDWLASNNHNRSLRGSRVTAFARDMREGRWQFNGEPIQFSVDGTLLNGQHRLSAIVASRVTLPMLVVRGLPRQSQNTMDAGSRRTAADALTLSGHSRGNTLAATAKLAIAMDDVSAGRRAGRNVTTPEVLDFIESVPSLIAATDSITPQLRRITTPAVATFCYWRLAQVNPDDCARFFEQLSELTDLPQGSPILALHRRLSAHVRKSDGFAYRMEAIACIFTAWNAWRRGETRTIIKLAYRRDGRLAMPEPA